MAVKKTSSKTSKRAKANVSQKASTAAVAAGAASAVLAKKAGWKGFLIACIFLLVGFAVGAGAWWFVCRNDTFEIVGSDNLTLTLDEVYVDEGVKIVAFGKDDSKNYEISTNLHIDEQGRLYSSEIGTFYIKYSTQNIKYGELFTVEKVRLITFVETSEGGE